MAKPIFLIGIPKSFQFDAYQWEVTKNYLTELLTDYHVIMYPTLEQDYTLNVLNAENMEPLQFDELKKRVEEIVGSSGYEPEPLQSEDGKQKKESLW